MYRTWDNVEASETTFCFVDWYDFKWTLRDARPTVHGQGSREYRYKGYAQATSTSPSHRRRCCTVRHDGKRSFVISMSTTRVTASYMRPVEIRSKGHTTPKVSRDLHCKNDKTEDKNIVYPGSQRGDQHSQQHADTLTPSGENLYWRCVPETTATLQFMRANKSHQNHSVLLCTTC